MALKIGLGKWSSNFEHQEPINETISKEKCALPMKSGPENPNKGLMHKFSAKLEAVLSSFPLESNIGNDDYFSKDFGNSTAMKAKFRDALNASCQNTNRHDELPKFKIRSSEMCSEAQSNGIPLIKLPTQNSMDRMELTLKLSGHAKLSDSDESVFSSKVTPHSSSQESFSSCSSISSECIPDDDEKVSKEFMKMFTIKLFNNR